MDLSGISLGEPFDSSGPAICDSKLMGQKIHRFSGFEKSRFRLAKIWRRALLVAWTRRDLNPRPPAILGSPFLAESPRGREPHVQSGCSTGLSYEPV